MSMKSRILAGVGGVGLTLAVAVTAVTAGGPLSGSAAPSASPSGTPVAASTPVTQAANASAAFSFGGFGNFGSDDDDGPKGMGDPAKCEDVRGKLATNLGVTTDTLEAAIKKTLIQEIDEAEQAGKLTADQAKTARDRINSATNLCAGFGLQTPGVTGDRPEIAQGQDGGRTFAMFGGATYEAAAKYFGTTVEQLRQDMADLGTVKAVAAKYGKDTDAGKAGLKTEIENALKADLAQRGLPQEMIDRVVAGFNDNFDAFYTAEFGHDMPIGPGGPGKRGPRTSPSPSPSPTSQTQ